MFTIACTPRGAGLRALILAFGMGASTPAWAAGRDLSADWPHWRGPLQNGVAPKADPPATWSETQNVKYKIKLPGTGWATPIVLGNRIFIQTAIPTGRKIEKPAEPAPAAATNAPAGEGGPGLGRGPGRRPRGEKPTEYHQFVVMCLDRATGKTVWQKTATEAVPHEPFRQNDGTFASSSGLTDGEHYFAWFGSQGLYCYDLEGNGKWSQDLGDLRIANEFGEGNSAALFGDTLVVNFDHEGDSFITALDKKAGKTLWKQAREERTSWSTPYVLEHDGKAQAIVSATGKIRSYELATGKVLWEAAGMTRNVIPMPIVENGIAYCASGFQGNSLMAIKLGGSGDLTGTDSVIWSHRKSTPYVPSPVLTSGRIYFLAGNNGVISCLDAKTGAVNFEGERLEAINNVYSSLLAAKGKIYVTGRNGAVVVLKDSEKLEVLATNQLDEKFEASPVAVGKELFLRGREYLYCLTER